MKNTTKYKLSLAFIIIVFIVLCFYSCKDNGYYQSENRRSEIKSLHIGNNFPYQYVDNHELCNIEETQQYNKYLYQWDAIIYFTVDTNGKIVSIYRW